MSILISCDMYLRLGMHVKIRLYYVLPYKAKISAQHGIGLILDRCIVYLGLTRSNLQKKRLLIFEIFDIKKCTLFFLEPSISLTLFHTIPFTQPGREAFFENFVRKGENVGNQHFLLFPQCFLPFPKQISIFWSHLLCRLQILCIWTGLEFCRSVKS